jgi:hypothetical protein
MSTFGNLLSKKVDQVEKPKPLPEGTYVGQVLSHALGKSQKKQTPQVEFTLAIIEAGSDVDSTALEAAGGLNRSDGNPRTMKLTYYITEDSLFRLSEFLKHLGLGDSTESMEMLIANETAGKKVGLYIGHRAGEASAPGEEAPIYAEIKKTVQV